MKTVGIVGCGLMGSGIAQICAEAGYLTRVVEVSEEVLQQGIGRISRSLERRVGKGKISAEQAEEIKARMRGGTRLEDLEDCELVIEAIIENVQEKQRLFEQLDSITDPSAVLASNTSSISIIVLASKTGRPDKVVGMHFFNPVPVMKLVEIVRSIATSDETVSIARDFIASLGKEPITCPDTPAFIVNKLLVPYLLDAIRMVESGIATPEEVDKAMQLGCGHPMGPLALLDFVGLDTTHYIAEIMFNEFKDSRYASPILLRRMVAAGYWGAKVGKGFYDYDKK